MCKAIGAPQMMAIMAEVSRLQGHQAQSNSAMKPKSMCSCEWQ